MTLQSYVVIIFTLSSWRSFNSITHEGLVSLNLCMIKSIQNILVRCTFTMFCSERQKFAFFLISLKFLGGENRYILKMFMIHPLSAVV